jgi:archaellin
MSVVNFVPTIWDAAFLKEREPKFNGIKGCYREYEGSIKQKGDRVKIKAIGDINVNDYTKNNFTTGLTLQTIDDQSTLLEITQSKYYNFAVDSVDAAQADAKLMQEAMRKAGLKQNSLADKFIYSFYGDAGNVVTNAAVTSLNVTNAIVDGLTKLYKNDVPEGTEIRLEVSPDIYAKLILAKILKDTDNSGTLKNGKVGNYLGCDIYLSNNLSLNGNVNYCLMRTTEAIAYAEQLTEIKAGDLGQKGFGDYVKGLMLYGAKVIKPKELVRLELTPAAEA